jgi:peptidoglycan hydrolase-like protein with peptidoglycan-binding domain
MTFRRVAIAASLLFVALVAGCGDDDDDETTSTTAASTAETDDSSESDDAEADAEAEAAAAAAISELQDVMTDLGYYTGPIDGVYGPATTDGVKAMQEDLGVTADGIYGEETHNALGDKAVSVVMEIQTALAEYGYYAGEIDGAYGPATTEAVEALQADLGVTVDGRVGPDTVSAFNEAVESGTITPA